MDYLALVKQAFQITWRNKFLWIFGILAGGGAVSLNFSGLNFSFDSSSLEQANQASFVEFLNQIRSFYYAHELTIWLIILILLLFFVIIWIFSLIFQGALIGGVAKIEKGEKTNFKHSFSLGWQAFWRILGLKILISIIILIFLIILSLIIIGMFIVTPILAIILGVLLMLCFWFLALILSLIVHFALRITIIKQLRVIASLKKALTLFKNFWLQMIIIALIVFALGMVWGIVLLFALVIIAIPLVLLGIVFYTLGNLAIIIYATIITLLIGIIIIILSGAINVFFSSIWTLSYLELEKK